MESVIPAGLSPNLLFEWAMPVLSGQGIAGRAQLDIGVQCWVLVALKEGLAAVDMPVLHQHSLAVLMLCHNLLRSEATSVHLIAPVLGLVSEVRFCSVQMQLLGSLLAHDKPQNVCTLCCVTFPRHGPAAKFTLAQRCAFSMCCSTCSSPTAGTCQMRASCHCAGSTTSAITQGDVP